MDVLYARLSVVKQLIGGASDCSRAAMKNVCVTHRRRNIAMAEELLDGADVVPVLEQMGRESMSHGMRGCPLADARNSNSLFYRTADDRFVQLVPPPVAGLRVLVNPRGREVPSPWPLPRLTIVLR